MTPRRTSAAQFAQLSQVLRQHGTALGLKVPSFRTPVPHQKTRSIRRFGDGTVVVAVPIHGRHPTEVLNDMIDGIVAANPNLVDAFAITNRLRQAGSHSMPPCQAA